MLDRNYLLSRLCYYDKRNPDHDIETVSDMGEKYEFYRNRWRETNGLRCACDNCFYSRSILADYALSLLDKIESENPSN